MKLSILGVIALSLSFSPAIAQNEQGTRPMNKERFTALRYWRDTSTTFYHAGYPILRSLPPLNSGMPWSVMATYIYMDSLARFDEDELAEQTATRWKYDRSLTDTLKWSVSYLYQAVDYNPIIWRQYVDEVDLKYKKKYVASLSGIQAKTTDALYNILTTSTVSARRVAMLALAESDYILRVHVQSIDSMPTGDAKTPYIYRVSADVLDTLKGKIFQSCLSNYTTRKDNPKGTLSSPLSSVAPCIRFTYLPHLYSDPRYTPPGAPRLYSARDPEFARADDSLFRMRPGQEAIVFIRHTNRLVDSTHDYYHLMLERRASMGALPIIDGHVRDINQIWSNDLMTPYATWRTRFLALRDQLISGAY